MRGIGRFLWITVALLLIATAAASPETRAAWEGRGAEVLVLDPDADGRVPPGGLMAALGKREVQTVLVEGGSALAWSAVQGGVVDRLVLYLAPKLVGRIPIAASW